MIPTRALRRLLVAHVVGAWAVVAPAALAVAAADPQPELALRVDAVAYAKGRVGLLVREARRALRVARVATTSINAEGRTVRAALRRPEDMDRALAALRSHFGIDEAASAGAAGAEVSIRQDSGSVVSASLLDAGVQSSLALATDQSVERIRSDLSSYGVSDGIVLRDDLGVIRIRAPQQADIDRMKGTIIDRAGVRIWRLIDAPSDGSATAEKAGAETRTLYRRSADGVVARVEAHRRIVLTAHEMIDARQVVDPASGHPVVQFRLDRLKAGLWSEALAANAGGRVAVAAGADIFVTGRLDRGSDPATGQISGDFPVDKAAEVAALLRRGMSPVPLVSVEDVSLDVPGASQHAPN